MTPDIDFGAHADHMQRSARLWSALDKQIAAELDLPASDGVVIADVGCGTGQMALLFGQRVAARGGRVLAIDREPVLLDRVTAAARAAGLAEVVTTLQADLAELPQALPVPVQLAWAGHVVHHTGDQAAAVAALAAGLAPNGVLAIAEGGLQPRSLPWDVGVGQPGLEARLEVAHDGWFAAMRADLPGSVRDPRGWPSLLRAAGLAEVTSRAWLLHRPAPLSHPDQDAVLHRLDSHVERAQPWLSPEDRAAWAQLLDRDDPAWLGHRDDLYVLAVQSVHLGRRRAGG